MPTMGRLTGAILFGFLAWYTSALVVPLFPENTNLGRFKELNTFLGLYAGWTVAGSRAGKGYIASFSYGLTASAALLVMALFFNSFVVMIEKSLRKLYTDPGQAVTAVFELFVEYGAIVLTPEIILTLVIGGFANGLVTEFLQRKFG